MKTLTDTINEALNEARIGVAASIGTLKDIDSFALTKIFNMMIDGEETMGVKDQNGKYVPEDQVDVVRTWLTNQCTIDRIDWDSDNNKNASDPEWFFKTSKLKRTPLYIFWAFDKPEPFKSKIYEDKAYIIHINNPQTGRNRVILHAILDILKNSFVKSGGVVVDNITKAYTYTSC